MILGILKVSGHSMLPRLAPGDQVITSSIPYFFSKPKAGDMVVFKKNDKMLVKRIVKVSNNKLFVRGDNKSDSLRIEPIKQGDILGRVTLRIKNNL